MPADRSEKEVCLFEKMGDLKRRDWNEMRHLVRVHRRDPKTFPSSWVVEEFERLDAEQMAELMRTEGER